MEINDSDLEWDDSMQIEPLISSDGSLISINGAAALPMALTSEATNNWPSKSSLDRKCSINEIEMSARVEKEIKLKKSLPLIQSSNTFSRHRETVDTVPLQIIDSRHRETMDEVMAQKMVQNELSSNAFRHRKTMGPNPYANFVPRRLNETNLSNRSGAIPKVKKITVNPAATCVNETRGITVNCCEPESVNRASTSMHSATNWRPQSPPPEYQTCYNKAKLTSRGIMRLLKNARTHEFYYATSATIKVQRNIAEKYFEQFYDQYLILGSYVLDPELLEEVETLNSQTEASYTALITTFNSRLEEIAAAVNADETVPRFGEQKPMDAQIKLGAVRLDTFNGDSTQWPAFKDTYETYVHKRIDLSDASKFWYLVNSLEGDAKDVIAGFSRLAANYTSAWKQLLITYDDEGRIVDQLVVRFLDIVAIDRPNQQQLMNLVNRTHTMVQSLSQYGIDAEAWGPILVPIIRRKLDGETQRAWRQNKPPKEIARLQTLLDFIRHRANSMDEDNTCHSGQNNNRSSGGLSANRPANATTSQGNGQTDNKKPTKKTILCSVCKEAHPVYRCPKFAAMSFSQREAKVKALVLCKNCLRPNHDHNSCSLGACPTCGEKHNSKLLPCRRSQASMLAVQGQYSPN